MGEVIQECKHQAMDIQEVEALVFEYHWRKSEIQRLQDTLNKTYGSVAALKLTATYGVEAAMPVGSKGKSLAEYDDMDRRDQRLLKRIENHQNIIMFIELGEEEIKGTIHETIYSCMMDGMSYRAIAKHLKTNREKVRLYRDDILSQLCQSCHFCQNWRYLKNHKQII